jgi:hypothetical protein
MAKAFDDRGTKHTIDHLRKEHRITDSGIGISKNPTTIQKPPIDLIVLQKLIVEWIVDRRHSFNEIEAESFHKIITYIDFAAVSKLPKSANTIHTDIVRYYNEVKSKIVELLSTARSNIYLSFDL